MRTRRNTRSFESLESRFALAGNVTATVDGSGNLLIRGDELANAISFVETSTGRFNLTGFDAGGSATSINGAPNGTVHLSVVTGTITIRTNEGDDVIRMPYFNYGGWIVVNAGNGTDNITLGDDAKPSFLVGGLSIRTYNGADSIVERNINVIGFHDYSGFKGGEGDGTSPFAHQTISISDSTFGSLLYAHFGLRRSTFIANNVIVAGELDIFNTSSDTFSRNHLLDATISDSFVGEDFNVSARTSLQMTIQNTNIIGKGYIYSDYPSFVEEVATELLEITDASFGELEVKFDSYNDYDFQKLTNVVMNGNLTLKSRGGIFLENVTALDASLASVANANSYLDVQASKFRNLNLRSGDAGLLTSMADDCVTNVFDSIVEESLTISTSGRIYKQYAPDLSNREYVVYRNVYNLTTAKMTVSGSTIGNLILQRPYGDTDGIGFGVVATGPAGLITFTVLNSTIRTADLKFLLSDDSLTFESTQVTESTYLDGGSDFGAPAGIGTGTNLLSVHNSLLANLTKVNFE